MTDGLAVSPTELGADGADFGIAATDQHIIAVGGTTSPFVMVSSNARDYARRPTPTNVGLRRVLSDPDGSVYVVGEYGTCARSDDDGWTWTVVDTATSGCLFGIARAGDGRVWICGDDGHVARFAPDATTTERVDVGTTARLHFLLADGDTMYVIGTDGRLRVWRAGAVEVIETPATAPLTRMARTPTGALLLSGDNGFLARADPGGLDFTPIHATTVDLECVTCLPDGRIIATGGRGVVLVSTDDGVSFASVDSGTVAHLWTATPFGTGVVIGANGGLLRVAEPGDDTWADRPDTAADRGPGPLDAVFADGPDGFLATRLRDYLRAVANNAESIDAGDPAALAEGVALEGADFLQTYGVPMPTESGLYFAGEGYSVEGGWTESAVRSALDAVVHLIHNTGTFRADFEFDNDYPEYQNWLSPEELAELDVDVPRQARDGAGRLRTPAGTAAARHRG